MVFVVLVAASILGAWGSNAEGQTNLLDSWVKQYVEEKAVAINSVRRTTYADISSIYVGSGGDSASAEVPSPSLSAAPINGNSLVALGPVQLDYIDQIGSNRTGIVNYTVQEGDLLSFIASDFGVSAQSIMWANGLRNADSIKPGQVLRIPPVTGVIHVARASDTASSIAKKYGADTSRIIAFNHLSRSGNIEAGDEIIVPDGRIIGSSATNISVPTKGSIDSQISRVGTYTKAGSALAAIKFGYLPDLGDYFINPSTGFNWGILHGRNGVDEANSCGTPVYAAADGTVTVADAAGWNGGFGKYIKISHPNGTETLYGHLSKIIAQPGQVLGKGDKIALIGTTGRSTGCHLHFEVHGARNPLAKY